MHKIISKMIKPNCLSAFLVLLVLTLNTISGLAQQVAVIGGVVKDKEDGSRISDAKITNQRTGATALSSSMGLFKITAAVGDTLLISKRDYSDFTAAVPPNMDMVILLNRERTLKEVNIIGQSKKNALNELKREYKRKGSFYQGKPPFLSFLFTPLTALYEVFGRTPKNARRFGRYYENELQQTLIDGFFNESIIQKNTDLKGADLEKFMLDYRPTYEKVQHWAEYDAIRHINASYKKYTDTLRK